MGPGLLAPLNHANITTIHGLEEADGVRFIAMECVEGETLPERNARSGRVEVREALDGSAEAASVVDEGHARGLARWLPWVVAAASLLAVVAVLYWSPVAGGPPAAHQQFHLTFPEQAPTAPTGVMPLMLRRPALALSGDISARLFESRETVAVYGIGFHPRYVEPGFLPTADRVTLSSARFDPDELGGVGELEVVLDDLRTEIPMRPAAQYAVSAIGILASAPGTVGSEGRLVRSDPGSSDFERNAGGETRGALDGSATSPGILERDTLTGDWGGGRTWLKERGITLEPRLTQFYQGMTAGEGDKGFEYGGKADLLLRSDLGKLGLWDGLSLTVQAEYNFGQSVNEIGGTLLPVNTALLFPGLDGADAFDVSSFYFRQTVGDSFSMVLGKINMFAVAAGKPFAGGAGIDAFWNVAFAAPPSGTVPPYLLGALLSFKTEPATFGLWIYDPDSVVNEYALSDPFADGLTIRGAVDFPVSIADRKGHQGFAVSYSSEDGNDLEDLGDIFLPTPEPGTIDTKDDRYYFAYYFDQSFYQPKANSEQSFGLFGQAAISDGNPNKLDWNVLVGLGGTGLIPGASRDNWGVGFFYYSLSTPFKEALAPIVSLQDELGLEIFYNHSLTPWFVLGLDLQIVRPARAAETAILPGLRAVLRF